MTFSRPSLVSRRGDARSGEAGLSLMETLVALAVIAMVTLVVFNAMANGKRLTDRVFDRAGNVIIREGETLLVRQVLSGFAPGLVDDGVTFRAGPVAISGRNFAPFGAPSGVERIVSLTIEAGDPGGRLVYQDGGEPVALLTWTSGEARFDYLTDTVRWVREWPDPAAVRAFATARRGLDSRAGPLPAQTAPTAIRLTVEREDGAPFIIVAALDATAPRNPPDEAEAVLR